MLEKLFTRVGLGLGLVGSMLASACSGADRGEDAPMVTSVTETERAVVPGGGSARTLPTDDERLNDPQIVAVLSELNAEGIELGKLARTRAADSRVSDFANRMVSEHGLANQQVTDYERDHSVLPQPSSTESGLEAATQATVSVLAPLAGHTLDVGYVHQQVEWNEGALSLLGRRLLPAAQDPALVALVQATRAMVAEHLAAAQALAEVVDQGSPALGLHHETLSWSAAAE